MPRVRLVDFAPGETIPYSLSWDGTRWDEASRRYVVADAGEYIWAAQFVAYHPDNGMLKRFDLDFPVTVI